MVARKKAAAANINAKQVKNSSEGPDNHNHPSAETGKTSSHPQATEDDDLSFLSLIPAIIICTLVSIASYFSCESANLAEDIIVATIRTFVQLNLLAALLSPLFRFVENHHRNASVSKAVTRGKWYHQLGYSAPIMVIAYVMCFMLPLAAYEAASRSKLTLRSATIKSNSNNIVFLIVIAALFISVSTMATIAIFIIIKPSPRYSPRHVIPLCGMLFNNSLSSISLALDILFTDLRSKHREGIELMVAFGANVWTATRPSFRSVLAMALKPQINSMNVIGLVAIPGMMTGQLLGGQNPTRAAWYQIIIMSLIMGAVFVSVSITIELVIWNAFDDSGALRDDWIVDNDSLRVSQFISVLWVMSASSSQRSIGEKFSTNEVKATTPELVAVELSVKGNDTKKLPDDGASPQFQIDINGSYANGKRTMAASFAVSKGVTILQGESGIGKSTLLKSIAKLNSGFTPSSLSNATVKLNGKDRESFHPTLWRKQVLYIPQHGSSALQGTPESFLNFIASSHHHKNSSKTLVLESLKSQTINYMEKWKVTSSASKLAQPWSQLSGGEAQRILLSIALSTEPKILLLDEPTSAIDLQAKLVLEQSLKDSAENGLVIVLVTHDEDQMNRLGTMFMSLDIV